MTQEFREFRLGPYTAVTYATTAFPGAYYTANFTITRVAMGMPYTPVCEFPEPDDGPGVVFTQELRDFATRRAFEGISDHDIDKAGRIAKLFLAKAETISALNLLDSSTPRSYCSESDIEQFVLDVFGLKVTVKFEGDENGDNGNSGDAGETAV